MLQRHLEYSFAERMIILEVKEGHLVFSLRTKDSSFEVSIYIRVSTGSVECKSVKMCGILLSALLVNRCFGGGCCFFMPSISLGSKEILFIFWHSILVILAGQDHIKDARGTYSVFHILSGARESNLAYRPAVLWSVASWSGTQAKLRSKKI